MILKDSSTASVDMTTPSEDLDVETMNAAASSMFTVGSSILLAASFAMLLFFKYRNLANRSNR